MGAGAGYRVVPVDAKYPCSVGVQLSLVRLVSVEYVPAWLGLGFGLG